jgi:RES domain-containing protein
MLVYRIARDSYINDFSGEGARLYGGRWNRPGLAVLYTSQARSLALLELLVHFSSISAMQQSYHYAVLEVPDEFIVELPTDCLPKDILLYNQAELWSLTDHYFLLENTLALRVPSVLVNGEYNYLLNPAHALYKKIRCLSIDNAVLDERYKAMMEGRFG